ncbi:MAG TPA: glucose-1-phosphate cytidylyltransferase [Candidatus Melainabacteria bacterium]|jgi:glucose-1-phosphate cytidylyltransferase|nr:glucose-1-phosphate cytidylyltransferase [Candidatus Melainabacteria bacterium]HIN64172.1 glucose-1-phosphate cytidylyltransferase [Candidatus Obscuribacterales bacterium]
MAEVKSAPSAKVVILAGGQGLRMREETETRPKPMVEVGGQPIMMHIMRQYASYGFKDFVICLGYRGDVIKKYFLDFHFLTSDFTVNLGSAGGATFHGDIEEADWSVTLADTGLMSETGSRFKQIQKYVNGADLIMLTYGDGLANVDIGRLVEFHRSHGKIGTVTGVLPPSPFGEMKLAGNVVEVFQEKPNHDDKFINGGFFVFDQRIFDYVSDATDCSLERDCLKNVAKDGELMMFRHEGFWQCLDTQRDLVQFQKLLSTGKAPWLKERGTQTQAQAPVPATMFKNQPINFAPPN